MLRRTFALVTALATVGITACGSEQAATPATSGPASATSGPRKVVVLDYNVLDTMQALGVADRVVGTATSTLPEHLRATYGKTANVGTMQEPDVEKIAELEPDAILIGGRTAEKEDELDKVAPTTLVSVDASKWATSFTQKQQELGDLFGKRAEADEKLTALDEQFAATKKQAAGQGNALIILVSGGKLSAFGPGSRFGMIHDVLGVTPAAKDLKSDTHGQAVSFEFVKKVDPDRLYVVDRDAAIGQAGKSAKQVLDNDLVRSTKAWKNGKVTYLDGSRWYLLGNGLANTSEMTRAVQDSLS